MDPLVVSIGFLGLSVAGHAVVWLFKTPKESANEMAKRMDDLEDEHHALDKNFTGFAERMFGEIKHLSDAINRLSAVIGRQDMGVSGEHRVFNPAKR